jgi:hypothetical protein
MIHPMDECCMEDFGFKMANKYVQWMNVVWKILD